MLAVTRLLLLWHSANRATRALGRFLIGDCLPFPLAGRPFHRFQVGALTSQTRHRQVQLDVSFLLRCQRSRVAPSGSCNSTRGRSFLRPINLGPKATHQLASPHMNAHRQAIRISTKPYASLPSATKNTLPPISTCKGVTRFVGFKQKQRGTPKLNALFNRDVDLVVAEVAVT